MMRTIYDLKSFYECKRGRIVQPLLMQCIQSIWPDAAGLRMMGAGYAVPFLAAYRDGAERVFAVMPEKLGVHGWAPEGKNCACLSAEGELPIETESIDRILLVHSLEYTDLAAPYLDELWRVLKSTGRILVVVPNRRGLWARAEWSPFGHGVPYSGSQLAAVLRDHLFAIETVRRAVFIPPLRSSFLMRSLLPVERFLSKILPGLGGVVMVEASKQIYSGVLTQNQARAKIRGRRILIPSAATRTQTDF